MLPALPDILLTQPPEPQQEKLGQLNSQPEIKQEKETKKSFESLAPSTKERENFRNS